MTTESREILDELRAIREDISYLKEHLRDSDVLLTDEDIAAIKQAEKDLKEGKTKRLV